MKKIIEKSYKKYNANFAGDMWWMFSMVFITWISLQVSTLVNSFFTSILTYALFALLTVFMFVWGVYLRAKHTAYFYIKPFKEISFNGIEGLEKSVFKSAVYDRLYISSALLFGFYCLALFTLYPEPLSIFNIKNGTYFPRFFAPLMIFVLMMLTIYLLAMKDRCDIKVRQILIPKLKDLAVKKAKIKADELAIWNEERKNLPWYKKLL